MKIVVGLVLSFWLLSTCAFGQSVSVTVPAGSIKSGQTVTATVTITNTLTPKPPLVLGGWNLNYTDASGNPQTTGGAYSWAIVDSTGKPVTSGVYPPNPMTLAYAPQSQTYTSLGFTLPGGLSYVLGSATSTVPVTGTIAAGVLTLGLGAGAVLTEGQQLAIWFRQKAQ